LLLALEKGINSVEENPLDTSVGFGGMPDNQGNVTLDACIMDHLGNAGSVCYMQDVVHAVSVARKIMEETPHVIISGKGATDFAISKGFKKQNLLTENAKEQYKKWLEKSIFKPEINVERHDTIGMIARNKNGKMSGACSTSGLAFKLPGRVGDSPIIGSGLYVDNEIGSSTATGMGELVLKHCSTFLVVELMRNGLSPKQACKEAVKRIVDKQDVQNLQVGLIALNKNGQFGGFSIRPGFNFAVSTSKGYELIEAESFYS
jgi:N4-(beta-N-acetylglucosaminyl)-L-asparaginase